MMKILIAVSDRDFLSSFSALLRSAGYETDTAADGTMVVSKLTEERPDMVILESTIPRISSGQILSLLAGKDIPAIEISDRKTVSGMLIGKNPANAYLPLPFLPDELLELIENVREKKASDEVISVGGVEAQVGKFLLCGKERLCAGELDVMKALAEGAEIDTKRSGAYINSLNIKLERLNKTLRIRYLMGEGYRLVNSNE